MPLVSVVVPVHNGQRYLRQCLESLVTQTLTDIEILVVDDGSTDGTPGIIREYERLDPRLIGVLGPATGSAGSARNVGLDRAAGEFLAFIDGDDFADPGMLEALHRKAVAENADVVAAKFRTLDNISGVVSPADWGLRVDYLPGASSFAPAEVGDFLFASMNPAVWNKMFRTSFIREYGLRFQDLRRTNDAHFTYTALVSASRITYVDDYLLTYRVRNSESLQGSLHEDPLEFVQALRAIRSSLEERGEFDRLERAFVSLVVSFFGGNLNKCGTPASFKEIYTALRSEFLDEFGVSGRSDDYFLTRGLSRTVSEISGATAEEWLFFRLAEARWHADAPGVRWRTAMVDELIAPDHSPAEAVIPDVSVIVPVYNSQEYLQECYAGICAQSGVSIEIIFVNDGSTDGSRMILEEFRRADPRVVVVNQNNAGLSGARNSGMDVATGRFVCFLDSDDYWQIDAISELVKFADDSELEILLFDAVAFRGEGVTDDHWEKYRNYYTRSSHQGIRIGVDLLTDLAAVRDYRPSACLYLVRSEYLRRVGTRFYPRIAHEDNAFTYELLVEARRAAHQGTPLYARRVRPGSIMTSGTKEASAHGYLVAVSEMLRTVSEKEYPPKVAARLGEIIAQTLRGANQALPDREGRTHEMVKTVRRADVQALLEALPRGRRQ